MPKRIYVNVEKKPFETGPDDEFTAKVSSLFFCQVLGNLIVQCWRYFGIEVTSISIYLVRKC